MTDLARYFQSTTRQAVMTPLSVANTGGAAIGQAVMGLGETIDGIAQRDEQFWVQKAMSDIDNDARGIWENATTSAGDGAANFETSYLQQIDQRYEAARMTAPSPRALRMFESQALNHRGQQQAAAQGFATQEKYEYRRDSIMQEADNLAQELYRFPSVPNHSPVGALVPPGLPAGSMPDKAAGYYSSGGTTLPGMEAAPMAANLDQWQSSYYSPKDFADGVNMADRSGPVMVSKRVVSSLDWVTDQFGQGKLQINSGYRTPASNQARAESGPEGPHTHGESLDVQVRDLPQSEKNRLYSLFKAAGANAFGFGEGVLHVEWREGQGNGRNGDHEWTYGGAAKYDQMTIAGPGLVGGTADTPAASRAINQYPYLPVVSLTARNETGTTDLATASLNIAQEANGTVSFGALGLNTEGMLPAFVAANGAKFGLTAPAGSPEFANQWQAAVQNDPEGMVRAQIEFHENSVVKPAQRQIVSAGAVAVANDPRVVAFASDLIIQYGQGGAEKHIKAGAGAQDATTFINAVTESTKRTLDTDFATALGADPSTRPGLMNRIDARARDSMGLTVSTQANGNVPKWDGPVPNIEDSPGYADRMARITAMIDTIPGTPNQRRDLEQQMRGQVTKAWLSRVAELNPPAAMAALMSGRYDNDLEVADQATLMGGASNAYRAMESEIREAQKALISNLKIEAQATLADEIVSVTRTGKSLGALSDAHMAVLTDAEKEDLSLARFQYDTTKQIAAARNDELPGLLEALRPDGDGFAAEQVRYDYAQEAVAAHLKAQAADPATYTLQTYPQLAQRWQAAMTSRDPAAIEANIRAMAATQNAIGIKNPQLLPTELAQIAADGFNNAELPEQQRIQSLVETVLATKDPTHQRLIFDQLVKSGVPPEAEAGFEAHQRGDTGAARRLFQAVMLDPSKLPGKLSNTDTEIQEEISARLMDQGQVGDLYYGLTAGDAMNYQAAQRDADLIKKAVQLRLVAGDDLGTAVDKVGRDMFGDVEAISGYYGVNTQILIPKGTDPLPILDGLAALNVDVRAALEFKPATAAAPPAPAMPANTVEPGNINLDARPVVRNADGSISTERSFSFEEDGVEILIPTVFGGAVHSEDEAVAHYRETGEHLGKFSTPAAAEAYAETLHKRQDAFYNRPDASAVAVTGAVLANYTDLVLSEGYYRNSGDGYVFIDPFVGQAVSGPNGKPLVFTEDQVMTASRRYRADSVEAAARAPDWDSLTMQERQALENTPEAPIAVEGNP